jgi:hypothetical protein
MALLGERCWYLPRRLAWLPGWTLHDSEGRSQLAPQPATSP